MGNLLVDISGNSKNITFDKASSTKEGLRFRGSGSGVAVDYGIITGIKFRIKPTTLTEYIGDLNATQSIDINAGTLRANGVTAPTIYVNGVESVSIPLAGMEYTVCVEFNENVDANAFTLNKVGSNYGDIEYQDMQFASSAITPQQAAEYHNSFTKPNLLESFKFAGADGIVKVPEGFIGGTGSYKVGEEVIEQGEKISSWSNSDFDTFTISGSTITSMVSGGSTQNCFGGNLDVGKKYKIKFTSSQSIGCQFRNDTASGLNAVPLIILASVTAGLNETTFIATANRTGFYATSAFSDTQISNFSLVEIPPLPGFITGTKYLENSVAGTIARQSKQAYGEWEFTFLVALTANNQYFEFLNNNKLRGSAANGYEILITSGALKLVNRPSGSVLFSTINSYSSINTYYRIKIARLSSEGIFKDIETLQVSDCVNSSYTSFVSKGRYGFSAVSDDNTINAHCGTEDELTVLLGEKYLIEFDLKLNSGNFPDVAFYKEFGSGLNSNRESVYEGRNSIVLTIIISQVNVISFRAGLITTDYEISGLTIRRIYDADTFAVFIRGGAFSDKWNLVSTDGGSGSNPVADSNYTESEYMVLDLDSGDRISNIKLLSQTNQ